MLSVAFKVNYAALILRPGTYAPVFVPLFEEDELVFLTNRSKSWLQDYIEKLYAYKQAGNLKSIYQLVWQPLEKELSGVTTLYYAPEFDITNEVGVEVMKLEKP